MAAKLAECWPQIASWANVAAAHRIARRGKGAKAEVARFDLNWENDVTVLSRELETLSWRPGPFRTFTIYEGKARTISAVPYRDRVVHQAIMNVLRPHLEASFIDDTYACRVGKGTEAARARAQEFLRTYRYYLHLDVVKYFPSISHLRLKAQLREHVVDPRLLEMLDRIVDHDGSADPAECAGEHAGMQQDWVDDSGRRGLPIGSLTSQWFANLYLASLDRGLSVSLMRGAARWPGAGAHEQDAHVTAGRYLRYMDDVLLFGDSKAELWAAYRTGAAIAADVLGLKLHPPHLAPCAEGVSFLGMRLFPDRRRLLPPSGYRFRRRMKGAMRALAAGRTTPGRVEAQVAGWLGHAGLANTVALVGAIRRDLRGCRPEARTA